ncbi:DUF2812 domain-containing protein [Lacticaseibacillus zhaodongensis]|uniref:DUF2812 domain-containing protein n=1 Tax=Lacticaseibacillus zhaodongensis TaxID=2668065 RepID=UPI0012D2D1CB|nr:DUF2812 domain-containing protein [Lacticaseibacillus zhaodongensis]
MFRYHFIRNNLEQEQAFLNHAASNGYILQRVRGARYHFVARKAPDGANYRATLVITNDPDTARNAADQVVTGRLSKGMFYNVLYTRSDRQPRLTSDADAVAQFHTYMLDHGTAQEWKGGAGIFLGMLLIMIAVGMGHTAGWTSLLPLRLVIGLVGAGFALTGLRGIVIGLKNTVSSIHFKAASPETK